MSQRRVPLVLQALRELIRYDLTMMLLGFGSVHQNLVRFPVAQPCRTSRDAERRVCDAVGCAQIFYWKRVRCLQQSVVTARLLRCQGVPARLVIGYRSVPSSGHAWIEVDGRVVNGSQLYMSQFQALERI